MASKAPIEIFMPPNVLKAKVGSGGGTDTKAIERAEKAMKVLSTNFGDWLSDDVANLGKARDGFIAQPTLVTRDTLFRAAHDLKGQATTFDFPIIARIASSLTKLLDEMRTAELVPVPLVDAHVTAIRVAFRDKVKSANDIVAITLAKELEARVAEIIPKAKKLAA
jgi:chemotaxis protein histidine kinase CheA